MKSAGKARSNGLYRHIRTSKEIIRNLLNDCFKNKWSGCMSAPNKLITFFRKCRQQISLGLRNLSTAYL